jgi:polyadenylate-binding protein
MAFTRYPSFLKAKVVRDKKTGKSKGFGFVSFANAEMATKAVTEMNGRHFGPKHKPLYVGLAETKEVRQAKLAARYAHQQVQGGQMMMGPPMFYHPMPPRVMGYHDPNMQVQRSRWGPGPGGQRQPPYMQQQQQYPPQQVVAGQRDTRTGGQRQQRRPPQQGGSPGPLGGPPKNVKYANNVRNQGPPQDQYGNMGQPDPIMPVIPMGQELTAAVLANAEPRVQKQLLGEKLYPLVQQHQPELAGKITGMLLEMDNTELIHFLESPDALRAKIQEAVDALNLHLQEGGTLA